MAIVRRFLSRRWLLAILGLAALLVGLAMLHPYPRQSLFGPTIRGEPWCVWEDAFRRHVHSVEYDKTLQARILRWMGVANDALEWKDLCDHADMLPLLIQLADDDDHEVRMHAVAAISQFETLQHESALPVLYRRLEDDQLSCRINAAGAIWDLKKDEQVIPVLVQILKEPRSARSASVSKHTPTQERCNALYILGWISGQVPELFAEIVGCSKDADEIVRSFAMIAAAHSGKKALPVLIDGLGDRDPYVRQKAAESIQKLGADANKAVPSLQWLLKDSDRNVRGAAIEALRAIDRSRFQHLQAE